MGEGGRVMERCTRGRKPKTGRAGMSDNCAFYTEKEGIILAAAEAYKVAHGLRFLTILEMVEVVRELGI